MIRFTLSEVKLQSADDGNTTYFGGHYKLAVESLVINSSASYHFYGNDRQNSAEDCILKAMTELGNTLSDEAEDALVELLGEFLSGTDSSLVVVMDDDKLISVDPM